MEAGCDFLAPTLAAIHAGNELDLVELRRKEVLAAKDLPGSLGAGEAESIAVCLNRAATQLLTNDKRARNFCREHAIPCHALICQTSCVRSGYGESCRRTGGELLRQIETVEGMVIKNKDEILK